MGKGAVPSAHCSDDLAKVRLLNDIMAVHSIEFTNHLGLMGVEVLLHFCRSITIAICSYFAGLKLSNFDFDTIIGEPTADTQFPHSSHIDHQSITSIANFLRKSCPYSYPYF